MKTTWSIGFVSLLAASIAGCGDSGGFGGKAVSEENKGAIVGVWNCVTKAGSGVPDMSDSKTFGADGLYSSSKFPEGKSYAYRLEGDQLIVAVRSRDWAEKITRLTADTLEYHKEMSGKTTSVSCRK